MIVLAVTAGVLAAAGIMVIARELRPAPPRLDLALARIQAAAPQPGQAAAGQRLGDRAGGWLAEHLARPAGLLALPSTDLALLERSAERFMLGKLALFLAGVTIPALVESVLALAGSAMSWTVPVLASLLLATGLSFLPM